MRKSESRVKTSPAPSSSDSRTRQAIAGQIFGQALQRTGKVARQVVTRDCAGRRLLVQILFEAFPHKPGFRHPPRLGLSSELRVELIGQLHRDRSHDLRVIRAVLPRNTRNTLPSSPTGCCRVTGQSSGEPNLRRYTLVRPVFSTVRIPSSPG